MRTLWPFGLRAAYQRDVARLVRAIGDDEAEPVRDAELATLPAPVQRYLRFAGVVGRPHVHTIAARMHGRIRSGPEAAWMPIVAEQHNVLAPAARLCYFDATMAGVPVQGYHRYVDGSASMVVRLAAVIPVARASGV